MHKTHQMKTVSFQLVLYAIAYIFIWVAYPGISQAAEEWRSGKYKIVPAKTFENIFVPADDSVAKILDTYRENYIKSFVEPEVSSDAIKGRKKPLKAGWESYFFPILTSKKICLELLAFLETQRQKEWPPLSAEEVQYLDGRYKIINDIMLEVRSVGPTVKNFPSTIMMFTVGNHVYARFSRISKSYTQAKEPQFSKALSLEVYSLLYLGLFDIYYTYVSQFYYGEILTNEIHMEERYSFVLKMMVESSAHSFKEYKSNNTPIHEKKETYLGIHRGNILDTLGAESLCYLDQALHFLSSILVIEVSLEEDYRKEEQKQALQALLEEIFAEETIASTLVVPDDEIESKKEGAGGKEIPHLLPMEDAGALDEQYAQETKREIQESMIEESTDEVGFQVVRVDRPWGLESETKKKNSITLGYSQVRRGVEEKFTVVVNPHFPYLQKDFKKVDNVEFADETTIPTCCRSYLKEEYKRSDLEHNFPDFVEALAMRFGFYRIEENASSDPALFLVLPVVSLEWTVHGKTYSLLALDKATGTRKPHRFEFCITGAFHEVRKERKSLFRPMKLYHRFLNKSSDWAICTAEGDSE